MLEKIKNYKQNQLTNNQPLGTTKKQWKIKKKKQERRSREEEVAGRGGGGRSRLWQRERKKKKATTTRKEATVEEEERKKQHMRREGEGLNVIIKIQGDQNHEFDKLGYQNYNLTHLKI